jgi:hypothetical protein
MAAFEAEVVIDGPQERVFDVVTTAGLWPQWAVLARAVAGVTERPFHPGDPIYEFCRTPIGPQEVLWHITEHDRPHHAKLQAEDGQLSPTPSSGRATTPPSGACSSLARRSSGVSRKPATCHKTCRTRVGHVTREASLRDWSQTRPEAIPVGYATVQRKLVDR